VPDKPIRSAVLENQTRPTQGKPPRAAEEYFLDAIATVRANRRNYTRSTPPRLPDAVKICFQVE